MCHNFLIHSSIDGHLGCFHVLAVVNSATMNNGIHVSFSILVSSGYMPRSGIAGSYGGFIPEFFKKKKEGEKKKNRCLTSNSFKISFGIPVFRMSCFHCPGHGFKDPTSFQVRPKIKR